MARAGIIFLILFEICSAETVGNTEPSVVSVKVGESVTLNCTSALTDTSKPAYWFKQRLEHKPQEVGFKLKGKTSLVQNPFNNSKSGFELKDVGSGVSLSIKTVQKEDEGMYFCGSISEYSVKFSTGTLLAVSDPSDNSVLQTITVQPVPPGEALNLQCTVEICRRIIVGNGTAVDIKQRDSSTGLLVVALGVFSGVCVVVICAQAIIILKLKRSGSCAGKLQPVAVVENAFSQQDQNADSLNYASVQFKEKKPKREERRRREEPEELVYSQVRSTTHRPKH